MGNKKLSYLKMMICILVVLSLTLGCSALRRPSPEETPDREPSEPQRPSQEEGPSKPAPEDSTQKPKLPEILGAGQGQEPNLKVFIKDENRVQEMKMEEYIKSVVAGEIKNDWPPEAIKAQAIIARTFVLDFIDEKGQSKFGKAHISTDIEEAQAWNPQAVNDRIKKAVDETRGLVMVHQGKFVKGWFHSNAAGKTATPKEGLNYKKGDPPYIKSVESPDDSPKIPSDESNWVYKTSKAKIIEALGSMGKPVKDFSKVSIAEKGPSGRATVLAFDDTRVSAPDFRVALSSTELKSTMLDAVEMQGDQVVFKGRGYGHGVGMSQWGAYKMAEEGKKAEEILSHYFQGIEIVNMWK